MKNNRVQFWRIVMTYVIVFYHLKKRYGIHSSGYIAVEFFFIVSGYLLANKYYKLKEQGGVAQVSPWNYFWGKYKRFWPYSAFAFFIAFAAVGVYKGFSVLDYVKGFFTHIPELFLFNMLGFPTGGGVSFNDVSWYLSVLLILSFFIWFLMKTSSKVYAGIVVPLSIVLIYPYLYATFGTLAVHKEYVCPLLATGVVRGLADMNLGIAAYFFSNRLRKAGFVGSAVFSSIFLLLGGVVLPLFFDHSKMDYLMLLFLFMGITAAFACEKNALFDNSIISKWADLTLVIYLNHEVLTVIAKMVHKDFSLGFALIWLVVVTVYSAVLYLVITTLLSKISVLARKKAA